MRLFRTLVLTALFGLVLRHASAADPVTVELKLIASVGVPVVTVGDVATVSGGDAAARARVARIDLAELKSRDVTVAVGQKSVEYRLLLAGFEASAVRVTGAERTTVTLARKPVTADEVVAVARAELLRHYAEPDALKVELAVPVLVKLPDIPVNEKAVITAKARGKAGALGRVQMDMTVSTSGESLLSLAVHLNVQPLTAAPLAPLPPVAPAAGATPARGTAFASAEVLVNVRQRVEIQVNTGGIKVSAVGEAQQAGKLGQTILVQNIDSKKTISARVTGPARVEVDLGGTR